MEIFDINTRFGAYPAQHPDSTPESLVAMLEKHQVGRAFALSTWGLFYSDREGNAETLRACQEHSQLLPAATINPLGYWGQDELIEAVTRGPFQMFRFFPGTQGWPLDFAPFAAILRTLGGLRRLPVMVSIEKPGDATLLARLAADFPHPVILEGVSGATLPEAVVVLRANPNLYLETHALRVPDALPLLRDALGIERLLFGSDAPGLSLGASLRAVLRSPLSPGEQAAVLARNALQLWSAKGGA